jgi:hypothetical protein
VLSCATCGVKTAAGFASSAARRKVRASIFTLLLLADLSLQARRMPEQAQTHKQTYLNDRSAVKILTCNPRPHFAMRIVGMSCCADNCHCISMSAGSTNCAADLLQPHSTGTGAVGSKQAQKGWGRTRSTTQQPPGGALTRVGALCRYSCTAVKM